MGDQSIEEARSQLEARLEELRPALEEASRIEAALTSLRGNGPRPPVTVLDTLEPVPEPPPAGAN